MLRLFICRMGLPLCLCLGGCSGVDERHGSAQEPDLGSLLDAEFNVDSFVTTDGEPAAGESEMSRVHLPDSGVVNGRAFTLKLQKSTGENRFAQLSYECNACSFEQFAAIVPPVGWSKSPTQVILPEGELLSTPMFDGVPGSMDFVEEIPGDEFRLIAKAIDGRLVEIGAHGVMAQVEVMRDTRFRFHAGQRIHEATDLAGNAFILFAYEVESENFEQPDFQSADALADQPIPMGWQYSTRVLTEELIMASEGVVTVLSIRGDVSSVWQKR